jgi:predicted GIY-YIG superfamily endonuclease
MKDLNITLEKCIDLAKLCKTKMDFYYKYGSEYNKCAKNGWLDKLKDNWEKPNTKYTREYCQKLAEDCNTKTEFRIKHRYACIICDNNKWLNDLKDWETPQSSKKDKTKYTFEKCQKLASYCDTIIDFQRLNKSAYRVALKNNWVHALKDWQKIGNLYKRLIYTYLFILENGETWAYVGLTYNMEKRHANHLSKGPVHDFIEIHKNEILNPIEPVLMSGYVSVKEAQKLEKENLYRCKELEFKILNRGVTGGLGTCGGYYEHILDENYI